MDKERVSTCFQRASASYEREAVAQRAVAKQVAALIRRFVPLPLTRVLEIGSGTGLLTREITALSAPETFYVNDLCGLPPAGLSPDAVLIPGDAEALDFPDRLDAVFSASAVQWFREPARFFERMAERLRPGGFLIFSTFSPENLREVKALTGVGLDLPSADALRAMLTPFFDVIHLEEALIELTFPDALAVLRHLRETGVTGVAQTAWQPGKIRRFCTEYPKRWTRADGVGLTYAPIYVVGRVK